MSLRHPRPEDPFFRVVRGLAALGRRWHGAACSGAERLPPGAALLIGNHGLFGLEVPIFFYLVHHHTGRIPIGLADRRVFAWQPMRHVLARCGGHIGTIDNGLALLGQRDLVVCYPGGAREVFKARNQRYQLAWDRACGFARLAIRAGVVIVPFAALGVDDSYRNLGHLPGTRALLGRYAPPLAIGLGPLPLPVRFRFVIGHPIAPPSEMARAPELKEHVAGAVRALMSHAASGEEEERDGEAEALTAAAVH